MTRYGPPASDEQLSLSAGLLDLPFDWLICLALGLLCIGLTWRFRHRSSIAAGFAVASQVVILTAPLTSLCSRAVIGAYPTVDKQGSILFYQEGIHRWMASHPMDIGSYPPAQLIGVHVGHLWISELFDVFVPTFVAFNLQGLLYLWLAGWCTWALLNEFTQDARSAFVCAFPYAMSLHVFADLNWYTIEKAAIFLLPLYGLTLLRALRKGGWWPLASGCVVALAALLNLYLAAVIGVGSLAGGLLVLIQWASNRFRTATKPDGPGPLWPQRLVASYGWTALLVGPLVCTQAWILLSGPTLATPECFLTLRAAQDAISIWPPTWSRLELWRAVSLVGVALAIWGVIRFRHQRSVHFLVILGAICAGFALGPRILGFPNPQYMAAWSVIPFFWRIAKPEVFFLVPLLAMCMIAALALQAASPPWKHVVALGAMLALWFPMVRGHDAYPGFSQFVDGELPDQWMDRMLRPQDCSLESQMGDR